MRFVKFEKMNKLTQTFVISAIFFQGCVSALTSNLPNATVCNSEECQIAAQSLKDSIDTSVHPCDDFYLYACGNWGKTHVVTGLLPNSTIQVRSDNNNQEILDFLKKNNSNDEPKAVHKARQLFSLCLNEEANYKNGIQPVKDILSKIGLSSIPPANRETPNYDYISSTVKAFRTLGIKMFFDLGVTPNPYNRSVNVIGLSKPSLSGMDPNTLPFYQQLADKNANPISNFEVMRQAMITMCENSTELVCKMLNPTTFSAKLALRLFLDYESDRTLVVLKPHSKLNTTTESLYTLKELQKRTDTIKENIITTFPKFNWTKYIEETFANVEDISMDLSDPEKVLISIYEIDFIDDMMKFIYSNTLQRHEFGLWWSVVSTLLPYTDSKSAEMESNTVFADTREQKCLKIVNTLVGMATSYYYTTKEPYRQIKSDVREMVKNIKESFIEIVENATWMDKTTMDKSLRKAQLLRSDVVYPSMIKTTNKLDEFYNDLEITDNFLESATLKIQRFIKRDLKRYNQINDVLEDRWELTPNMVNAFYDPTKNTITIPAGILGAPVYTHSVKALDYGGVGSVLGHEITHGFDNAGRRYNEIGNVEDWWKPEALETYKKKAKCFIEAYNNYSITMDGITQKVDSKASFGENIADNGGFKEALFAYRKYTSRNGEEAFLPQFQHLTHEQLFTLGFANIWCERPTELSQLLAPYLDHSPNGVRVNGVLKNSEEFSKIWNCPKDSNMNPIEKCSLW